MKVPELSPLGRYAGRTTSRLMPHDVREIDSMAAGGRRLFAELWLSQAATELRVSRSFALVKEALTDLHADEGLVAIATRAVDDEYRHARLCQDTASLYLGAPCIDPIELPFAPPTHALAKSDDERRALHVIGQCAMNETFASAYLQAALAGAIAPVAKFALRELLADEVDHARIGWAFLRTLPASLRAGVEDWLLPLAIANLREWRALSGPEHYARAGAVGEEVLEAHGFPRGANIEAALMDALQNLILDGLRTLGFSVTKLEAWVAKGAPTKAPVPQARRIARSRDPWSTSSGPSQCDAWGAGGATHLACGWNG